MDLNVPLPLDENERFDKKTNSQLKFNFLEIFASCNFANQNSKSSNYFEEIFSLNKSQKSQKENKNKKVFPNKITSNLLSLNTNYENYNKTKIVYFSKLNDKKITRETLEEIFKGSDNVLKEINEIYYYEELNENYLKDIPFHLKNVLYLDIYCDFLYIYLFIQSKYSLIELNVTEFFYKYLILYNLRMYSINIIQFTSNLFYYFSTKALDMYLLILKHIYKLVTDLTELPKEALFTIIDEILKNLSGKFVCLQDINSLQLIVNIYIYISLIYFHFNKKEKSKKVFEELINIFESKILSLLKLNIHPTLYKENINFYINSLINYNTLSIREKEYMISYKVISKLVAIIDSCSDNFNENLIISVYYKYGKIMFNLKKYSEALNIFNKILLLDENHQTKHKLLKGKVHYFLSKIQFICKYLNESLRNLNEFISIYQEHYPVSNNNRLYNAYKLYFRIWTINNTYDTNLIYILFLLNNKHFKVQQFNISLILKVIKAKIDQKESNKAEGIIFYLMSMLSNIHWQGSYCKKIFNFFQDLIESNIYSKSLKVAIYLTKLLKDFIENNSYFLANCQDDEHVHFKQKILENFGVIYLKEKSRDCIKYFTDRQILLEKHYESKEKADEFLIKSIINNNYLSISHLKYGNKESSLCYFKKYFNRSFLHRPDIVLDTKYIKICENIINLYIKRLDIYKKKELFIYIVQEIDYLPTNMYLEKTTILRKISKYYFKDKSWRKSLKYNIKILDYLQKSLIIQNWDQDVKSKLFEAYLEIFYQLGYCCKKINDSDNFHKFSKYFLDNFSTYKYLDFPLTDKIIYYYSEVNFNLGLRTYKNDDLKETIDFISKALNNIGRINVKPTKKVSDCFYILGIVYMKLKDKINSKRCLEACYEIRKGLMGNVHSLTLLAQKKLEEL